MIKGLEDGSVLILGGTGTLGRALTKYILEHSPNSKITILSRDEHKQAQMKREFPKVQFVLGDISDFQSISDAFKGKTVVFHVAALKHVDIMEENPVECWKTNVKGTQNAALASQIWGVKHFIFSSTDKAIDPINSYGICKAFSEKLIFDMNRKGSKTKFSVYRWGNVLGSQGSAIPFFAKTLKTERTAYLTDAKMTRFWIPIEWAVHYMLHTFHSASVTNAMIPPTMKTASTLNVIETIAEILEVENYEVVSTGLRPGEKIHEAMVSQHSLSGYDSSSWPTYSKDELRSMLEPIVKAAV